MEAEAAVWTQFAVVVGVAAAVEFAADDGDGEAGGVAAAAAVVDGDLGQGGEGERNSEAKALQRGSMQARSRQDHLELAQQQP